MLEGHRARKAATEYANAHATWEAQRDGYAALLGLARTFGGGGTAHILLSPGETLFFEVTGAALVEERKGPGHYQGGSTGISIPVARVGGRSVRYRVGASRGHYQQAPPTPTAVDSGTATITSMRVVFQGVHQTRECAFAKLVGYQHDDAAGATTLSVSNRRTPTTIRYGPQLAAAFDFRLDLALAHLRGTVDQFVAGIASELALIDAAEPRPPAVGLL